MARPGRSPVHRPARAAAFAGLLCLVGCRYLPFSSPSQPPPPPVEAVGPAVLADDWSLVAAPERSSPLAPPSTSESRALGVARLLRLPDAAALPDAALPDWVFAPDSDRPLEPVQRFTAEIASGWRDAPYAGEAEVLAELEMPIAADSGWAADVRAEGADQLRLHVWIGADGAPAAAVSAEGEVAALQLGNDQAAAVGAIDADLWERRSGREYAPLPEPGDARVVWCRVPALGPGAIVLEVSLEPPPETGPRGLAFVRALADVRARVAEHRLPDPPQPLLIAAAERADLRRPLAVELARTANRTFLLDLVLLGPEASLTTWVEAAAPRVDGSSTRAAQAFELERAALAALSRDFDMQSVDPTMEALLIVHLGALGSEPTILADVARRATDSAQLDAALLTENMLLLDDPRAVVRVRALRWLRLRGTAPGPDFDPLAPREARRTALDAWRKAREAAPIAPTGAAPSGTAPSGTAASGTAAPGAASPPAANGAQSPPASKGTDAPASTAEGTAAAKESAP